MLTSTSSLVTNEYRIPEVCTDITLLLRLRMCPSKQSISQTSTWRPWLKTTCSEAPGKTDCTACRWPSQRGLLMFLIAGVTEIRFASLPPTHRPSPLLWLASWKEFMSVPSKSLTAMTEVMSLTNPAFVTGQAFLITDYLSAWYCKNSDIWWKEDKGIPGIVSDKQPFEKLHHLWHNFSLFIPVTPWMVNEKPYRCHEIWHPSLWVLQALYTNGIPQI